MSEQVQSYMNEGAGGASGLWLVGEPYEMVCHWFPNTRTSSRLSLGVLKLKLKRRLLTVKDG